MSDNKNCGDNEPRIEDKQNKEYEQNCECNQDCQCKQCEEKSQCACNNQAVKSFIIIFILIAVGLGLNHFISGKQKTPETKAVASETKAVASETTEAAVPDSPKVVGSPTDVFAEMDGHKITRADFEVEFNKFSRMADSATVEHYSTANGKQSMLGELADMYALSIKGEKLGYKNGEEYKKSFREDMTHKLAGEYLRSSINDVKVEENEARAYYDANKDLFKSPDSYHILQYSCDSKEKADAFIKSINEGKDFAELAKADSIDEFKDKGGDCGFRTINSINPVVAEFAASAELNKLSEPIKFSDNYYVVAKVSEKKAGEQIGFDVASIQIKREMLMQRVNEAMEKTFDRLKSELSFEAFMDNVALLRSGEPLTEEQRNLPAFKITGKDYSMSELEDYLNVQLNVPAFLRPQLLSGNALDNLIKQVGMNRLGIAYAEKNYDKLKAQYASSDEEVSRRVLVKMVYESVVSGIGVSDDEAKDFYVKNQLKFVNPGHIKAHHILVEEEENAKSIAEELKKDPSKFEDIAKSVSKCPSGKSGGDLGSFQEGQMVPEFDKACKELELGVISEPVKTQFGYHIIRVDERKKDSILEFEDVKDSIKKELTPKKQAEAFNAYLIKLRDELNVKLYPDNL